MTYLLLSLALSTTSGTPLPVEVERFIAERKICEHFRNEPIEGRSAEQMQRRMFVQESIEIHCTGTDRRLAALRRRYANHGAAMSALAGYEGTIEGAQCER